MLLLSFVACPSLFLIGHIRDGDGTWWVTLAVLLAVFHQGPVVVCLLVSGQLGREYQRPAASTAGPAREHAEEPC